MKIALIGYGKMGKCIASLAAKEQSMEVTAIVEKHHSNDLSTIEALQQAEVWLDFSHAGVVLDHVQRAIKFKKNILIGTTGWEKDLSQVQDLVQKSGIGCLFSPNFSLGVLIFYALVKQAAYLAHRSGEYAVAGWELHHAAKKDSPSGTAKALHALLQTEWRSDPIPSFSSIRCGHLPGTHTVLFNSPYDTLSLTHEAHSREGFAKGALFAAKWLWGKSGFFTIEDLAGEISSFLYS